METRAVPEVVTKNRTKLIAKQIIVLANGVYEFTQDYEFSSPSLAAAVVRGSSANGLVEWKNKDGQTLKSIAG